MCYTGLCPCESVNGECNLNESHCPEEGGYEMPNYFKVKGAGIVEISGSTIQGEGKKGIGNAAEQFVSKTLDIPVENITEISKEEFDMLDDKEEEEC